MTKISRYLKELGRRTLRRELFAPLFGWLLARRLRLLHDSADPDALNVLVFSEFRWVQDLNALARVGSLRLFAIDGALMARINALFLPPGKTPRFYYYLEDDPEILRLREAQVSFLEKVIRSLLRRKSLDCAATPSAHYRQEQTWAAACDASGLPFVALHKEYTVLDDRQVAERARIYRDSRESYRGTHLCVVNQTAKRLLAEGGVCPEDRMTVVGVLRMDNILGPDSRYRVPSKQDPKIVTLFSFGHFSGGLATENRRSQLFSRDDDFGFVEMFRDVHTAFAEAALRHPDVQFKIKPKFVTDWWNREIDQVVRQNLGIEFSEITNCEIVDAPAPELIAEATATIGFNSTVVLESRVLGRSTIIPNFAEATGAWTRYVYFKDFHDLFALASSKADLGAKIDRAIAGDSLNGGTPERLSELCRYYFGSDDGRTAARVVGILRDVAARRNPNRQPAQRDAA